MRYNEFRAFVFEKMEQNEAGIVDELIREYTDGGMDYDMASRVWVRVDHSEYTAEQLMRHELGHDMIAKGEVDPDEVRRELEKNYTPEQIKYVMQAYTELYAGSNLEPDEIWEEIICDSLGDMNAFSETYYGEKIEKFLLSAKTAARERGKAQQNARENAVPTAAQLRAERKKAEQAELEERHEKWLNGELSDEEYFGGEDALPFSRETRFSRAQRGRSIEQETMENNRFERLRKYKGELPEVEVAYTADYFYVYSNQSYMDYTVLKKVKISEKNSALINSIEEAARNGTYADRNTLNSWSSDFQSGHGNYNWDTVDAQGTRTTTQNNGVDGRERGRNTGRNSEESGRDSGAPVKQAVSSAKTSIKQIPALFKNSNVEFGKTNIDIGGGKFDLATDYLSSIGTKNMVFDPYNRSEDVNAATLRYLQKGNRADTATCANVLNVIAEPEARANVILEAAKSVKQGGTAYFMVYEGDGSGIGRETSSGYQLNRRTADYVPEIERYFNNVTRKGKLIIAAEPKVNLPKAAWETSPGNAVRYSREARAQDAEEYKKPISTSDIETLRSIGRKSINDFTSEDIQKTQKWAYKFYQELGTKSPFFRAWFGDWRANDTGSVAVVDIPLYSKGSVKGQRGLVHCKDASFDINIQDGWGINISSGGESNTRSHSGTAGKSTYGLANIRGLIENAVLLDSEVYEPHGKSANNASHTFEHKLYALGKDAVDGSTGLYKITVDEYYQSKASPNMRKFHNLRYIEKVADVTGRRTFSQRNSGGSTVGNSSATGYSVSDLFSLVKQYDSAFKPKAASKIANEDGTPKVVYHGTLHGGFTKFGGRNDFYYFTPDKRYTYVFQGRKKNGQWYQSTKKALRAEIIVHKDMTFI